jgi:predicted phosphodiesterase
MTDIKFQIISDLHLEFYKKLPLNICNDHFPKAPILFLVGDIGYPRSPIWLKFINWCEVKYERIFYVQGNHESYNHDINETTDFIRETLSSKPNFTFLESGVIAHLGPYKVVGCTLWSEQSIGVYHTMNDSKHIYKNKKLLTLPLLLAMHNDDKQWLDLNTDDKTIVVTHYIPSFSLILPQYRTAEYEKINCAYASNCDSIIRRSRTVIYGHTHSPSDKLFEDIHRCICNPYGYPNEQHKFFNYDSFIL